MCCESLTHEDDRQQKNFALNKVPLVHTRQTIIKWDNSCDFKFSQAKMSWLRISKEGIDGYLHFPDIEFPNAIHTFRTHDYALVIQGYHC